MPRVKRKGKRRNDYTAQERRVLLTGVPLHSDSTRFGHPIGRGRPLNIEAVRVAWGILRDELLIEWESELFEFHRLKHGRPWAERVLEGQQ